MGDVVKICDFTMDQAKGLQEAAGCDWQSKMGAHRGALAVIAGLPPATSPSSPGVSNKPADGAAVSAAAATAAAPKASSGQSGGPLHPYDKVLLRHSDGSAWTWAAEMVRRADTEAPPVRKLKRGKLQPSPHPHDPV